MTTPASLLIDRCGLSHREAAAFLGVRLDTVNSWSSGRNPTPAGVIDELRGLYARIEDAAARTLALRAERGDVDAAELGIAGDDAEAQVLGWPCVGAQVAMAGIVAARLDVPVRVVERGSTRATAVAVVAHGKRGPSPH